MNVTIVGSDGDMSVLVAGLLLLGLAGFLITRRWQKAIVALLPVALYAAWQLAVWSANALREDLPGQLFWYRLTEIALIGTAVLVGVGLPLLGMRRSRSRPAV